MADQNSNDLRSKIGGLIGKTTEGDDTAKEQSGSPQEEKTAEFDTNGEDKAKVKKEIPKDANGVPYIKDGEDYRPRTAEEAAKWKASEELKNKKDSVSKSLMALSTKAVSEIDRAVRELITARARIIGYITAKSDKVDFSATGKAVVGPDGKKTDEKTYTISLKNSAPSSIQYAIVKEPTALIEFKKELSTIPSDKAVERLNAYKNATVDENTFAIRYIPWDEMVSYVMSNTTGVIYEDEAIFTQYVKGSSATGKQGAKVYKTPADIKSTKTLPGGSFLYLSAKLAAVKMLKVTSKDEFGKAKKNEEGKIVKETTNQIDTRSIVTLKHSVRSKIITPANVVPLKRFQSVVPAASYTDEDANKMISIYLGKFNTSKNGKTAVVKSLGDSRGFTIGETGIVKTDFFATAGAQSWFSASGNSVAHWSEKNEDGSAKQIPATSVKLVKKEQTTTKDGARKIVTLTDDLGAADTAATYQFSAANFPNVFKAAGNLKLDFNELSKTVAANKTRKPKSSSNSNKRITSIAPDALIGLSIDEIANQIKAEFDVAKDKTNS